LGDGWTYQFAHRHRRSLRCATQLITATERRRSAVNSLGTVPFKSPLPAHKPDCHGQRSRARPAKDRDDATL
jgi:hypothetical protein